MFEVIITKRELYDKCENIEQLYDKFYYPLLVEYNELKKQLLIKENGFKASTDELCEYAKENQELKKQLEEYQLQNIDLRADIMIQKMAFPNKLIKDKTFYNLYNMSTYEELLVQQKEFIKYLEDEIYSIEPKGTGINYNCEYDSEEDYVRAMQEQSILNTLKESLQKYKEIIGVEK